mmetsp:Transcript_28820/g.45193  ORF Transcript_28820/g.45193 Transcript_28820/m.45193 type:complete len:83 (-) Transcript_28820:605-853(-)
MPNLRTELMAGYYNFTSFDKPLPTHFTGSTLLASKEFAKKTTAMGSRFVHPSFIHVVSLYFHKALIVLSNLCYGVLDVYSLH